MKVRAPIRAAYLEQRPVYEALKLRTDDLFLEPCREKRWHFESRVKDELSYALKIETGRVIALDRVEDFFGCTIVVRNSSEIGEAVRFVKSHCAIERRRPRSEKTTFYRPAEFEFDDLRLYVKLTTNPSLPPRAEDDRLFEVQIKTFLFHAWAIATHDLMYKANDVNWGRERIAFQVRAMLEHAETTIGHAEELARSSSLKREDRATQELRKIIETVRGSWPDDQLPQDLRRLSQNIRDLLRSLKLEIERWREIVAHELSSGGPPLDENPYQWSVRQLFKHEAEALQSYLSTPGARHRVVVYDTLEYPDWFDRNSPAVLFITA